MHIYYGFSWGDPLIISCALKTPACQEQLMELVFLNSLATVSFHSLEVQSFSRGGMALFAPKMDSLLSYRYGFQITRGPRPILLMEEIPNNHLG